MIEPVFCFSGSFTSSISNPMNLPLIKAVDLSNV